MQRAADTTSDPRPIRDASRADPRKRLSVGAESRVRVSVRAYETTTQWPSRAGRHLQCKLGSLVIFDEPDEAGARTKLAAMLSQLGLEPDAERYLQRGLSEL